jgi:PTH1 family peptidyl-tRNA hydrolase
VRLVVGLGNPGRRYAGTRHNVAWELLDELAVRWHATSDPETPVYRTRRARVGAETVVLMVPLTFMNASGDALRAWREAGAGAGGGDEGLLVVSDDVYLPVGMLRLRERGTSGGHRGLESIEQALGHRSFARLRIGVGAAESSAELRGHVLDRFAPEERERVDEVVREAADAVETWVGDGILAAMNRFNRRAGKEVREP